MACTRDAPPGVLASCVANANGWATLPGEMGKILGSRGPGIVTLIPMIDDAIWVDLQPTFHYKYGNLLTSDNRTIFWAVTFERHDWLEGQWKDVVYRSSRLRGFEVSKLSFHDPQQPFA